jgi:hypothetical protein
MGSLCKECIDIRRFLTDSALATRTLTNMEGQAGEEGRYEEKATAINNN